MTWYFDWDEIDPGCDSCICCSDEECAPDAEDPCNHRLCPCWAGE